MTVVSRLGRLLAVVSLVSLAFWASGPQGAWAAPFKCVDPGSQRVTYTDVPCTDARSAPPPVIVDNVSDSSAERRALADQAHRQAAPAMPAAAAALTPGPSPRERGERTTTCLAARRDYEIAVSTIKKDLALMNRRLRAASQACARAFDPLPEHEVFAREQLRQTHSSGRHKLATQPSAIVSD